MIDEWTVHPPAHKHSPSKQAKLSKRKWNASHSPDGEEDRTDGEEGQTDCEGGQKDGQGGQADGEEGEDQSPLPATNVFVVRLSVAMGRNRVVRRMLAAVGLPVYRLKRVQVCASDASYPTIESWER